MCRSILLLHKIAHQMWHDHPFSQRNMTTERALGMRVWGDREVGGVGKTWKREYRQYREGLHKIRELAPLCQLCKETLKISHPPHYKTNTTFLALLPFLVKISHPSNYSPIAAHIWKISKKLCYLRIILFQV